MDNEFLIQVKKMEKLDTTYAVFGQGTRMPFITCDEDTFNDQIWVFTDEESAQRFAVARREGNQDFLMIVKLENQQLLGFYSSLYLLGVNEVVFAETEQISKIPLERLVLRPDFAGTPEVHKPLTNEQLQLTGLYFMQEVHRGIPTQDKERLMELEEEMAVNLVRSRVLTAVDIQGERPLSDGSNIQFPCLKNQEGKVFHPVFTDINELAKFNTEGKFHTEMIEFANIENILADNLEGVVINPQGMNLIILKSEIKALLERFVKG